ncbi:prophage regulatory protein [Brevundimonas vesicularis]|uniref:helix-turn-helix transcriptional regulator n=1 Tax=Brevundimonas vesicularis TaxID=41276 RepID=UPI002781684A|nr:AlpA family phage regulatory protein [Brevundimonas vesicularis]MDQ1193885.1 prophage regulatory protein [Brevundimonas vesicularis]
MAYEDGLEPFLAWRQVRNLTGLGRTTAWRMRQAGDFPDPVSISPGRVAWRARDIAAWNASRGEEQRTPPAVTATSNVASSVPRSTARRAAKPLANALNPPVQLKATQPKSAPRRRRRAVVAEGQLGFDF